MANVKSKNEVMLEAQKEQLTVRFATLEFEPKFQTYKGRVVFRGDIVKEDSGSYAVFREYASSASRMTAAQVMVVSARPPKCAGQAADAESTYILVNMEDASTLLKLPRQNVQMFWYVHRDTSGQYLARTSKVLWFFSDEISVVIHLPDYCGKDCSKKFYWD